MDKKEQILTTAIELFNYNGLAHVSIRDIGGKLNMSSGNLAYHFKSKEDLLLFFYEMRLKKLQLALGEESKLDIWSIQKLVLHITDIGRRYPFFFIDQEEIKNLCPALSIAFIKLKEKTKAYFELSMEASILKGQLSGKWSFSNPAQLSEKIWGQLFGIWVLLRTEGIAAETLQLLIYNNCLQDIMPHLTHVGWKEMEKILEKNIPSF